MAIFPKLDFHNNHTHSVLCEAVKHKPNGLVKQQFLALSKTQLGLGKAHPNLAFREVWQPCVSGGQVPVDRSCKQTNMASSRSSSGMGSVCLFV